MKSPILVIAMLLALTASAKNYKGAEIYSNESYLYGKFEMKIKAAKGSGQLSTFFLYRNESEQNTTLWKEIDIEIFGKNTFDFQSNVIIEQKEGTKLMTEEHHTMEFDLSEDFHTFVIEWTPDSISWYVDSVLLRTEKEYALNCTDPMSIRFNHWAANIKSWVGAFDTSVLPSYQYVDYLSYYAYDSTATDPDSVFRFEWKDDFASFNSSRWSKANWTFGENLCDFLPANAYTEDDQLVLKLHDVTPPVVTVRTEPIQTIDTDTIDISTDVNIDNTEDEFTVFPNPFTTSTNISIYSNEEYCVRISSLTGTLLFEQYGMNKDNIETVTEFTSTLNSGKYVVALSRQNQIIESKIMIKN